MLFFEFILEFIAELFFEASYETVKGRVGPKWLRYILITIIVIFMLVVIGFFVLLGVKLIQEEKGAIGWLSIGFGMIFGGLFLKSFLRDIRNNKTELPKTQSL